MIKISKIDDDKYSIDDSVKTIDRISLLNLLESTGISDPEKWLEGLDINKQAILKEVISEKGVIVDLYEVDYPTPSNPLKETQELARHLDEKEDFRSQYLYPGSTTEDIVVGLHSDIVQDRENEGKEKSQGTPIPPRKSSQVRPWRDVLIKEGEVSEFERKGLNEQS